MDYCSGKKKVFGRGYWFPKKKAEFVHGVFCPSLMSLSPVWKVDKRSGSTVAILQSRGESENVKDNMRRMMRQKDGKSPGSWCHHWAVVPTLGLPLLGFGWSSREKLSLWELLMSFLWLLLNVLLMYTDQAQGSPLLGTPSLPWMSSIWYPTSSRTYSLPGVCPVLHYMCLTLESELPENGRWLQFSLTLQPQALLHSVLWWLLSHSVTAPLETLT